MCLLCGISSWSRRVATMLPWLVIPFIIVWALSQLLPHSYRLEVTSSRLACLGVLLSSLVWYELLMPWLSSWRTHRSAIQRERKLIEAQEAEKWRKEATRKCRNCLAAYKVQTPGSGRFVCTYCGHMSKRPVLEVPGALVGVGLGGLLTCATGKGGIQHSRASNKSNAQGLGVWCRDAERNGCAWFGDSLSGGNKCRDGHFNPYTLLFVLRIFSFIWRNLKRLKHSNACGSRSVHNKTEGEAAIDEIKSEKARKKAEKKKQARILKEILETEDRKQREEVALLVEEQRRQRDALKGAKQREEEAERESTLSTLQFEQNEQIGKVKKKAVEPVTERPIVKGSEHAVQTKSRIAGKVRDKVNDSTCSKESGGTVDEQALKYKTNMNGLARMNYGTKSQVSGSPSKSGPFFQSNGYRRGRNDFAFVAGNPMKSSGSSCTSLKGAEGPELPGSGWTRAPWISALLKGSKGQSDERSKTQVDAICSHAEVAHQGIARESGASNSKIELDSQCVRFKRGKEDGSLVVGDLTKDSDCLNMSSKASESPQVSGSALKRAPWISTWVRGGKGMSDESGKLQVDPPLESGKGLGRVIEGGFNSSNNEASIIKRPFVPVRGTAVHPPIAPPLTHLDSLQQIFSTPSLFSPMLLPVDLNSHQSDRNVQSDTKGLFQQEHSFFEAQKHSPLVGPLAAPVTSTPVMHRQGLESLFLESNAFGMQGPVSSEGSFETAEFSIQAPPHSPSIPSDLVVDDTTLMSSVSVGSLKVDNSDSISDKEVLLNGAKMDEETLQLPPFSTIQSLFDSETLTLDMCLPCPCPNVNEDVSLDGVQGSSKDSFWANIARAMDDPDSGQKVPAEFVDCITQEIMEDPVITADGHSYERSAIEKWLKNHDTSPKTGEVLPPPPGSSGVDKTLRPNHILRGQIIEYEEKLARISGLRAMAWSITAADRGGVFQMTSSPSVLSC